MQCAMQLMRSPECVHRHVYTCGDAPELSSGCCFPAGSPSAAACCCSREAMGVASLGLHTVRRAGGLGERASSLSLSLQRLLPSWPEVSSVEGGFAEWGVGTKAAARCRDGSAKPGVTPGGVPGGLGLPAPHPPRSLRSAVPWGASGAPSAAAHVAVCFLDGPRESPRGPAMGHAARPPPPPPFRSPAHCFGDMSLPSTPLTGIPVLPEGRRGEREWGGGWVRIPRLGGLALWPAFLAPPPSCLCSFSSFLSFFCAWIPCPQQAGGRVQA